MGVRLIMMLLFLTVTATTAAAQAATTAAPAATTAAPAATTAAPAATTAAPAATTAAPAATTAAPAATTAAPAATTAAPAATTAAPAATTAAPAATTAAPAATTAAPAATTAAPAATTAAPAATTAAPAAATTTAAPAATTSTTTAVSATTTPTTSSPTTVTASATTTPALTIKRITFRSVKQTFTSDLADSSSPGFKDRASVLKAQLEPEFRNKFSSSFYSVKAVEFRNGSVINVLDSEFLASSPPTNDQITQALRNAASTVNGFDIETSSISVTDATSSGVSYRTSLLSAFCLVLLSWLLSNQQ
ncbi:nuclear pore complex protein Nup58-like [Mastacembelus armatus]|uniref:nuclear pore complex protein Nup58-like n=1 Tax=Mastacembelus armatus TaxID=205130 RepID=UPI000E454794|nr:nuclear pore complex protein Nup58-like [Mastacembelus armatus]